MHRVGIAASLTALAVLTAACGPTKTPGAGGPVPAVSPDNGLVLARAWQVPRGVVNPRLAAPVGNVVVAPAAGDKAQAVFIDGTTGRVRGRTDPAGVRGLLAPAWTATTDERGRPLVDITTTTPDLATQGRVYDADAHLVWKSRTDTAVYAGGYVADEQRSAGTYREVIRTASGREVARLPLPGHRPKLGFAINLVAARPGFLATTVDRWKTPHIVLLDVSRPGRARTSELHAPSGFHPTAVQMAADAGHLYVSWRRSRGHLAQVARYDLPGTRPVWHRVAQAEAGVPARPGTNSGGGIALSGFTESEFWFLDPDTGTPIGREDGWKGELIGAAGGRAYAQDPNVFPPTETRVIDLRGGAVHTIDAAFTGLTTNGYLIGGQHALTAYRWN